ncbi:serine/threonine-protein kinase [Mycolicibacterium bacteremicum]|uniref:non-specific serine/threonine protein kinase n=1 Tax=Mycolicibacterium bacteremicum TaxID=564198 RepID=A0A1W9YSY6_MYCBA|nr:serine/threonine-protein kinase [Mycolicibacterium bacteremicum]MCV7433455.1 serine/threonine protein kinase [Mycolicibacterium bacteremicum]ORA03119.1 serine/threonine protein kinase [Mycolicibacterium bacteremicum]
MPLAPGATFAGYTIVRALGAGGMGEVYLAQHPRLPRQDALKVLLAQVSTDDEYRLRFEREADIAATLWHPHIVGVHDRGESDGQLWIAMDYVPGTDTARLLREEHPHGLPAEQVTEIITAVAAALDYAHQRNLLHRDVKPANILLCHPESGDRRIMLADFGIARWSDDVSGLTATNMTVGTVSYAAPEQLMGSPLDGRSDQYALAATAYELLTGTPPFRNSNPAVVISQHLSASPPAIGSRKPELAHLDPVFAKALAKDPGDRFDQCTDFARALGHQLAGDTSEQTRLAPTRAPEPKVRRKRPATAIVVAAVLAVLLCVAVVVAAFEFGRADDEQRPAAAPTTTTGTRPSTTTAPAPPPPPATTTATDPTVTVTTDVSTPAAVPVVGADCDPAGGTGTTADGSTVYCETLAGTQATIWSLTSGTVPSPTVTTDPPAPDEEPLPGVLESPVRVCMQQTGQTRRECREQIRISNGLP